jgi:hypothetical protein
VGAELFGNLMGSKNKGQQDADAADNASSSTQQQQQPSASASGAAPSIAQVLDSIRADYAEDYFISGKGAMVNYDPQCLYADPFVSFKGTERFKKNVSNLGAMM